MFLFFHIAIPLLLFEITFINNRIKVNRFALLIGAVIPDLLDKPLLLIGLGTGRDFAHSLLFVLISTFLVILIQKYYNRKKNLNEFVFTNSYLIGITIHLILDLPNIPFFYPFISYPYLVEDNILSAWLYNLFTDPIIFSTEIFGVIVILFTIYRNKLYNRDAIWKFLATRLS